MKRTLILLFLSSFVCSAVTASSINGDYKGSPIVKVTYEGQELPVTDVPAMITDGRTMVPLGLLRQAGFNVAWNNADYSVDISQPRKIVTLADIQRMANAVKKIDVYDDNNKHIGNGSGFIVSLDGEVVTASHVKDIYKTLLFNIGTGYFTNSIDFNNTESDLVGFSLTKINGHESEAFPYLKISKRIPKVGDPVYAIGYPNKQLSITQGIVKGIVQGGKNGNTTVIEHNAFIDSGSSGGPLLDQFGEVIGVNTDANNGVGEYFRGFATSSIYIQQELDKLR